MILKKITIENFRCFKNYEVDLTPGITVFQSGGYLSALEYIAEAEFPLQFGFQYQPVEQCCFLATGPHV